MKTGADHSLVGEESNKGWDETVLLRNVTVARIRLLPPAGLG
jgi:hypothetical protein